MLWIVSALGEQLEGSNDSPGNEGQMQSAAQQAQTAQTIRRALEFTRAQQTKPRRDTTIRLQTSTNRPTAVVLDPDGWVLKGDPPNRP